MQKSLKYITIPEFQTASGFSCNDLKVSYQSFGRPLNTAPVVLVNHALTGNSQVIGENGWWDTIIGSGKVIDTNFYTVLSINIPGNGFGNTLIENYKDFISKDIARLFIQVVEALHIKQLHTIIGGSLGGGISWEMAVLKPDITQYLIPVAADWKSSDWLIANCLIQDQILNNSVQPIHDARMHAMLCYRSPESFKKRFHRSINEEQQLFNTETWLLHHGQKLQKRFQVSAYKLMNQLLRTIESSNREDFEVDLSKIEAEIHIVSVDSDLFFTLKENDETYNRLKEVKPDTFHHVITSIHGHDAFLIEFEQLDHILTPIFQQNTKT